MRGISVIIPSYNSGRTIRRCLISVIRTGYPDLEVIVADDLSIDESPQIVEGLSREYPGFIRLIRMGKNSGPAKARNTGARLAAKEYLFFLDSDTVMLPDTLYNFSIAIQKADAVTGIYHYEPVNLGLVQSYKALFNYYFFSRRGVIQYEVFDASRAGIKAEVFSKMGGFNENLGWGMDYENEEFGYRLTREYKNILDPSIMVRHEFPGFRKLTKTYFSRVLLWAEVFAQRKRFESGGVTQGQTGISTASLLLAAAAFTLALTYSAFYLVSLFFLLLYFFGYGGFFIFVSRKKPFFLPVAFLLNIYFTLIIAMAFLWGIFKAISGRSGILNKDSSALSQDKSTKGGTSYGS